MILLNKKENVLDKNNIFTIEVIMSYFLHDYYNIEGKL